MKQYAINVVLPCNRKREQQRDFTKYLEIALCCIVNKNAKIVHWKSNTYNCEHNKRQYNIIYRIQKG